MSAGTVARARAPVATLAGGLALAGAFGLSSCRGGRGVETGVVRRDSAGVEIVENTGDEPGPASSWRVSAEPVVRLGSERPGAELFASIADVLRLPAGGIAVLESQTQEVRIFGPSGEHRRTVGGIGDGPGELRYARGLSLLGADTLAAFDLGDGTLSLFSLGGDYLGSRKVDGRGSFPDAGWSRVRPTALPLLPDGGVLDGLVEPGVDGAVVERPEEGVRRWRLRLAAVRTDGSGLDTLGVFAGPEGWLLLEGGGAITGGTHPFLSQSYVAAGADPPRLYLATNPEYSVEVWRLDGVLERVIRRPGARRSPTAEERERGWSQAVPSGDRQIEARLRSVLPDFELLPAVQGLATGPGGELWVKREPIPGLGGRAAYDVFDGAGRYMSSVGLPRDVDVHQVGDDWLLTTWTDELDVPYVGVFELVRGSG